MHRPDLPKPPEPSKKAPVGLLKIGELARQSGLTVRTLHHYDAIGLLKPLHRSEADYRLYDNEDVARLDGISALRDTGLSLGEIAKLIGDQSGDPRPIINQQIDKLDHELAKITKLRDRLAIVQLSLRQSPQPRVDQWLKSLSYMSMYEEYFSPAELIALFKRVAPLRADWKTLIAEVYVALANGCSTDSVTVKGLALRWMDLAYRSTDGNELLMEQWWQMYTNESMGRKQVALGAAIRFMRDATAALS
jgi:DNA-binding transcriptional MerR regulator